MQCQIHTPSKHPGDPKTEIIRYDDGIVRKFAYATVIWGLIGMLTGLWLELADARLNLTPWLGFGRLRPLHTNAGIFAFVGNGMFAGIHYSSQRLLKARMASDLLSKINFWGWQSIIVAAAIKLPRRPCAAGHGRVLAGQRPGPARRGAARR